MRLRLDPHRLDHELATRGLDARHLALLAKLSEATVSRARAGRYVDVHTAHRIAEALARVPALTGIAALLRASATGPAPQGTGADASGDVGARWGASDTIRRAS